LKTPLNNYFNKPKWNPLNITAEEYIDQYIKAEIPVEVEPRRKDKRAQAARIYRENVINFMMHTCSPNCIVDGKCSKRFPKPWGWSNKVSDNAYPAYRRRPPAITEVEKAANPDLYGETAIDPRSKRVAKIFDNRHVVAHNPYLLNKYKSQYVLSLLCI